MKRNLKLLVLTLVALLALSLGCITGAFAAEKPANPDPMTVHTGWWGPAAEVFADNKFEFDQTEQPQSSGCEAASNAFDFAQNRYKFSMTVHSIDQDGIDFYLFFDARGHAQAPWVATAESVWVNFFKTRMETSFGNFEYAGGIDLTDGTAHEIELIIDDINKKVVLWIDNVSYSGSQESINEEGQFGYVCFGSKITLANPSLGYTASSVTISAADNAKQVKIGETLALTAAVNPADFAQTAVTWSSENADIAAVDAQGVVTGVAEGTVKIKATTASGIVGEYEITVVSNVVAPTALALDKTAETLAKTQTLQLNATFTPAETTNKAITWTSSNEAVATVKEGLVTVVAKTGTATITATSVADPSLSAECTITAAPLAATAVEVRQTLNMEVGDIRSFAYSPVPAAADDAFIVSVEDDTIVSYEAGKLTALKAGETTVTVTSETNASITASCAVTVSVPEAPAGMPEYPDYQNLAYEVGVDPSIASTLTKNDNGFVFDATGSASGNTLFPVNGNVPATEYKMSAITFAMKIDSEGLNDWCAAVLFRTKDPARIFYSNPAGIELRFMPETSNAAGRMEVYLHHGENKTTQLGKIETVNPVDGLTHYYAIEVNGTKITVWCDGAKVVDNYEGSELFGQYFNVAENNSFAMSARAKLTVSDLNIYNTALEEPKFTVTSSITGEGSVTGIPAEAVTEGTAVTVTVTPDNGWKVKSVKVNGTETPLTNGELTLTITANTTVEVTFEKENQGGNENPGENPGENPSENPGDGKDEKKGCGSSVAYGSIGLAVLALGGACLVLAKKQKR